MSSSLPNREPQWVVLSLHHTRTKKKVTAAGIDGAARRGTRPFEGSAGGRQHVALKRLELAEEESGAERPGKSQRTRHDPGSSKRCSQTVLSSSGMDTARMRAKSVARRALLSLLPMVVVVGGGGVSSSSLRNSSLIPSTTCQPVLAPQWLRRQLQTRPQPPPVWVQEGVSL